MLHDNGWNTVGKNSVNFSTNLTESFYDTKETMKPTSTAEIKTDNSVAWIEHLEQFL